MRLAVGVAVDVSVSEDAHRPTVKGATVRPTKSQVERDVKCIILYSVELILVPT